MKEFNYIYLTEVTGKLGMKGNLQREVREGNQLPVRDSKDIISLFVAKALLLVAFPEFQQRLHSGSLFQVGLFSVERVSVSCSLLEECHYE